MSRPNIRTTVKSLDLPNVAIVSGRFSPNGTSAPDTEVGGGFSVTRAAAGTFNVVLDRKYKEVLAVIPSLSLAVPAALIAQADFAGLAGLDADNPNRTSFQLKLVNTSGATADIATRPDNVVTFVAIVRW